ncbi:MAG: DUF4410 domain-containing protein [Caldimonas sp.]
MFRSALRLVPALVMATLLGACASSVTRMDAPAPAAPGAAPAALAATASPGPVSGVTLWLNGDAKKALAENIKFNPDALKSMIERTLQARDLMKADSSRTLDIEITGMRVRSNFSAVMFGFMAGSDSVDGVVTIKDAAGQVVKKAKVSASYALGGFAGGQDEARMGWLYEEFAKHASAEVGGIPAK